MFFNEKDVLLLMPNICFYDAQISLMNIFCEFSLSGAETVFSVREFFLAIIIL